MEDTVGWTHAYGGWGVLTNKDGEQECIAKHAPGGVAVLLQSLPARAL